MNMSTEEEKGKMEDGKLPHTIILCVVTNLKTKFVVTPLLTETVGEVRASIKDVHQTLFPELGEMDVSSLTMKLSGRRFHVPDSVRIGAVFHRTSRNFLFVELSRGAPSRSVVNPDGLVTGTGPNGLPTPLPRVHDRGRPASPPAPQPQPLALPDQDGRLTPPRRDESFSLQEVHPKEEQHQIPEQHDSRDPHYEPSVKAIRPDDIRDDSREKASEEVLAVVTISTGGEAVVDGELQERAEGNANVVLQERAEGDANVALQERAEGDANVALQERAEGDANVALQERAEGDANVALQERTEGDANVALQERTEGDTSVALQERTEGYTNVALQERAEGGADVALQEWAEGDANVVEKKVKKKRRRHEAKNASNNLTGSWTADQVITQPVEEQGTVETGTTAAEKMDVEPQKATSDVLAKDSELKRSHKSKSAYGAIQSTLPGKDAPQDKLDVASKRPGNRFAAAKSQVVVEPLQPAVCNGSSEPEWVHENSHKSASKPPSGARRSALKTSTAQKIARESGADGSPLSRMVPLGVAQTVNVAPKTSKRDNKRGYHEREVNNRSSDARSESTTIESMGHSADSKKRKKQADSKNGKAMNGTEGKDSLPPVPVSSHPNKPSDHKVVKEESLSPSPSPSAVQSSNESESGGGGSSDETYGSADSDMPQQVSPSGADFSSPDVVVKKSNGRRSSEKLKYQHLLDTPDGFDELISMSQQRLKGEAAHHQDHRRSEERLPEPSGPLSLGNETPTNDSLPDSQAGVLNGIADSQEPRGADPLASISNERHLKEPRLDNKEGPGRIAEGTQELPREKPKSKKKRHKSNVANAV